MVFYQMLKFIIPIFIFLSLFIIVSISSVLNVEFNLTALDHVQISTPYLQKRTHFSFINALEANVYGSIKYHVLTYIIKLLVPVTQRGNGIWISKI